MHIIPSNFLLRQRAGSSFSYYDGPWEDIVLRTYGAVDDLRARPGYRDGVLLVDLQNLTGIYSGVVRLEEGSRLSGSFTARKPGEEPRKQVLCPTEGKLPAKSAYVVLYRSSVLAETGDETPGTDPDCWEIVSLCASPTLEESPITPEALMYNHFGGSGGTATGLSDTEFVERLRVSFEYWKDKVMAG